MSRRTLLAPAMVLALATCSEPRERLDVPRLVLKVDQSQIRRGGDITGEVTATDASGLQFLRVWALSGDSVMSRFPVGDGQGTLYGEDSVSYRFNLRVSCVAADNSPVQIQARTFDNQGFDVIRYDTVFALGVDCATASAAAASR